MQKVKSKHGITHENMEMTVTTPQGSGTTHTKIYPKYLKSLKPPVVGYTLVELLLTGVAVIEVVLSRGVVLHKSRQNLWPATLQQG